MVFRNTGDGLELRVSRHVTTSNSMPLALALCRASKSRAARSTSRAVGAYLHQQSMPVASVRAFSSTLSSRRVPVRTVRCRARSVTKGAALLGGWRQLTLLAMHACSCKCALERLPIRTVRHTVASHDVVTGIVHRPVLGSLRRNLKAGGGQNLHTYEGPTGNF